jgi:hypothetical protein
MEIRSDGDHVRYEKVLRRAEKRNIVHTLNRRKANRIGHIWHKNGLIKQVIEGKVEERIEVTGRGGKRCKQLLDDLKEKRG